LYFADDDLLAVHTLSRAAFRVLFDISPKQSNDGFEQNLDAFITRELGWAKFNRVTNFLKHADNDPDGAMDHPSEIDIQIGIGFALILHRRIAERYTPETKAFDMWMKLLHPNEFKLPIDHDPEFEKAFRKGVEDLKRDGGKAAKLVLANSLLQFFRQRTDMLLAPRAVREEAPPSK
jgi:hypothetical protein